MAGKTTWGASVVVAMLQCKASLDGVPLPRFKARQIMAVCLVLDYEQQKLSVQPAYLRALGDWPHVVGWKSKGGNIIGTIRVKQVGGSDDPDTWSILTFLSQENPRVLKGARLHVIHADEPPKEEVWQEAQARKIRGDLLVMLITATPLIRRQWYWIERDFPRQEGSIGKGKVLFRLSLYDNKSLTAEEIREQEERYENDPLRDARLFGRFVDASGACPFDQEAMGLVERDCTDPIEVVRWQIRREVDRDSGRVKIFDTADVQVWGRPESDESYYAPIDPSRGIDDPRHDPGGILWSARRVPRLVARYSGYLGAYGLGSLAAGVGLQYNRALTDPETSGGWGETTLSALGDAKYPNVNRQRIEKDGKYQTALGFVTNTTTRPQMIAAIQDWLAAYKAGIKLYRMPSRHVLTCLRDVILDDKGKPVAAPGFHDEDMILLGQTLRVVLKRRAPGGPQPSEFFTQDRLLQRAILDGHDPKPAKSSRLLISPRGRKR